MQKIEKVTQLILKHFYHIHAYDAWTVVAQLRRLVVEGHAKAQYLEENRWCYDKEKDFTDPESTCTYQKCLGAKIESIDGYQVQIMITVEDGDMVDGLPYGRNRRRFRVTAPIALVTTFHDVIEAKFNRYVEDVYEKRQNEALRKKLAKISDEIMKSL